MCCRSMRAVAWSFVGMLTVLLVGQPLQAELEFGIPTPVPSPINEGGGYAYPWIVNDGLTMYYGATAPGSLGGTDIMFSTRSAIGDSWSSPVPLGDPINTELSETFPSMTADGLELYFQRTSNPFTHADGEIFVSKRVSDTDPWGTPVALSINFDGRDASPRISSDGLTLYFDSARPQSETPMSINTWVTTRSSRLDPFSDVEFFFGSLGYVTDDGLTHLGSLAETGAGFYGVPNIGSDDIYMRTRESIAADFGPVTVLNAPLNTTGLDCCVALDIQGSTLYVTSSRPGAPTDGLFGFVNMWQAPLAEAISLDVNPGNSDPVGLTETILSAALLSTGDFDALNVDVSTLLFGDPLLIADGASPVSPLSTASADVNGDGLTDLTFELSIAEMRASGVIGLVTEQGYVAGELMDGTVIAGRDALAIVPEPNSLLLMLAGLTAITLSRRK